MVKVPIKLRDKSLPIPEYKTKGSVGFDLYLRNEETIGPREIKKFPANVIIKVPKGHFLFVTSRSSTIYKYGVQVLTGIIDQDYCGEEDEFYIECVNISDKNVRLEKGTRIAQGVLIKTSIAEFVPVLKMAAKSRGGFGTTGS